MRYTIITIFLVFSVAIVPAWALDLNDNLLTAAENGQIDTVKELLKKGANPKVKDQYDRTPLMLAAHGGHTAIVKILLDSNVVDINAQDKTGYTALIYGAFYGHIDIVKALLDKKADTTLKDKDGDTALTYALIKGHSEIIKMLKQ